MSIRTQDIAATDFSDVVTRPRKRLANKHPGRFLLTEFMEPHSLSANALATALHVPANRIGAIIKGQRAISADTALRLGHYFGTSAELWLNLQKDHELRTARAASESKITASIEPLAA
jgi:addiction module HigA family antidote